MASSMSGRTETEIQSGIIDALESMGIWVIRTGVSSKRGRAGTNSGEKGMPDLLLPALGTWIEVKTPIGKLSQGQIDWHAKAFKHGVRVAVVHDTRGAVDAVREWSN